MTRSTHRFAWLSLWACTACVSQFNAAFIDTTYSQVQVEPLALPADDTTTAAVSVKLLYSKHTPAPGLTITWQQSGAPLHVAESSAVTALDGTATFHVRGSQAGSAQMQFFAAVAGQSLDLKLAGTVILTPSDPNAMLKLSGYPVSTVAGEMHNVTLSAVDANGALLPKWRGSVALGTDDPNASFAANFAFDASQGPLAIPVTFYTAGLRHITAVDVNNTQDTALQGNILVHPGPAQNFIFACSPNQPVALVASLCTLQATDAYGNVATNYQGVVHLSSNDPNLASLGNVTFDANAQGIVSLPVMWPSPGTVAVVAQDAAQALHTDTNITIVAAPPTTRLSITYPQHLVAGGTGIAHVTAWDNANNLSLAYRGTVSVSSSDPNAAPTTATFDANDLGMHDFNLTLFTAGTWTVSAQDTMTPGLNALEPNVVVDANVATHLLVYGYPSPTTANAPASVTVVAEDAWGNTATDYNGMVQLSSNANSAMLPAIYAFSPSDAGMHVFAVQLLTAGTWYIDANDLMAPDVAGRQSPVVVAPGPAARLQVSGYPNPTLAGAQGNITVTAYDAQNNVVTGYIGTVHVTSTDGAAVLPSDYTFASGDSGTHVLSVTLAGAGTQAIAANDTTTPSVAGSQSGIVVQAGPAVRLSVTGYPSPTAAGAAHPVTVTAYDANNNVANGYTGTVHLSSSDPNASMSPNYTFTAADAGSHVLSLALATVGPQSINANDTVTPSIGGGQTGVVVNPGPALRFAVTGFASPTTAGIAHTFNITAYDANNNIATNYVGAVHVTSSDANAHLPANYTFVSADAGSHNLSAILATSGIQSLNANDATTPSIAGGQTGIVVNAGAAVRLRVAGYANPTIAGASHNVGVTAYDANNNIATGYTGTVHLVSSDMNALLPANYTFGTSDAGSHLFSVALLSAGSQSLQANDRTTPSIAGLQSAIVVDPNVTSRFSVSGYPSPTVAGTAGNVVVVATDAWGNLTPDYNGTVHFTATDSTASLPLNYSYVPSDLGSHTFGVVLSQSGTWTLDVNDVITPSIAGSQANILVDANAAVRFTVSGYPSSTVAGTQGNVTVTAYDNANNVATGYTGTVIISSSDASAQLPSSHAFVSADNGVYTFLVTLKTSGTWSISANDTSIPTVAGAEAGLVVSPNSATHLLVTNFVNPTIAGQQGNLTVSAQDAYNNIATGYVGTVHVTSSDGAAALPTNYTFVAGDAGVHTLKATLATTGTQSLQANDTTTPSIAGAQAGIVVNPGAATHLGIAGYTSPTTAGSTHTLVLTAYDANNNVATGYMGTVHVTSSDGAAILPANYTFNGADAGTHTLSATLATVGTQSLQANDTTTTSIAGAQTGIVVNAGPAVRLTLTGYTTPTTAGAAHNVTVTAYDANNNIATGYTGTVHVTSSDGAAALPANYTFVAGDAGVHNLSVSLATVGTRSISANDTTTTSIAGVQTGIVVNPGAAARLGLAGYANPTAAGAAHNVTVTAYDANNNIATGYTGTVHLTSSDGAAGLPANYTFVAGDAGVHALPVTLATVGTQGINANDTTTASIAGGQTGIVVNAGNAVRLTVTGYTNPTTAGAVHNASVTAYDANNNIATGYTGTVHLTSSDGAASLPANYTFVAGDAGVHNLAVTLATAGTQSINANDTTTASIGGGQTGIVVNAGNAVRLSVTGYSNPTTAGAVHNASITAYDANNNIATNYTGTVHLTSTDGAAALPSNYTFAAGDAGVHALPVTLATVGTQSINANDTTTASIGGGQTGIVVHAGNAVRLAVTGYSNPTTAGAAHSANVTAYDANNNVATGYTGTVHLTSTDGMASLPVNYTFVAGDAGVHALLVTLATVGTQSINANDTTTASIGGGQTGIVVNAGAAVRLAVTGFTNPTIAGAAHNANVTAYDANNNVATGYTGMVHITSTDGAAGLPANYTFVTGDAGIHALPVTLATVGTQSINANDTTTASIGGGQTGIVVNPGAAARLTVTGYSNPTTAGVPHNANVTAYDANNNIATGYTGTVHLTSSDGAAGLPANYTFVPGDAGVHALPVTLATVGTQSINANDTTTASIGGGQTGVVVNSGAAVRLTVTGYPNPTSPGVAHSANITAYDANNNVATGYTGTIHITSTDGAASLPANYTFVAGDAGVHALPVTLATVGTQSINANDTTTASIGGGQTGIVVNAGAAVRLTVTGFSNPTVAGAAHNATITAYDASNNVATGYTGTVHLTSTDGAAGLPANYTFVAGDAGVHALPVALATVGTQSINANDTATASIGGGQTGVVVNPGPATRLTVTGYTTPTIAGVAHNASVTAYDANNNIATGYTGTVHITSTDGMANLPANYTFAAGDAGVHVLPVTLATVGTQSINANDTTTASIGGGQTGIVVNAGSAVRLSVTGYTTPTTAGAAHNASVTAYDANNNIATGYTGTVHLTSTDGAAGLPANYTFVAGDAGVHALPITLATVGTQSINANDTTTASIGGGQTGIVVTPASAVRLTVTGYTTPTTAGAAHNASVTAYDANNNIATGYTGTVHITSTDAAAGLPANYTFVAGDAGVHALPVTLATVGTQSINANDTTTASIGGGQTGIVVNAGNAVRLTVTGYTNPTTAGVAHNASVTAYDANNNIATGYTGTVHITSTDAAAGLPSNYTFLAGDAGVHALPVTLATVGTQSINANDTTTASIGGGQTGIVVNAGNAVRLTVAGYANPTTAGVVHNASVTAYDANNNIATGYTGTVHLTSTDGAAGLPANYTFVAGDAGVHALPVTLATVGTQSINANDTTTASIGGGQTGIVVNASGAVRLTVTGYTSPTTAGAVHNATVTAYDANNNIATGYTGTVHVTSTDGAAGLPANYTFLAGDAGVHALAVTLATVGTQSINANDTTTASIGGGQTGIVVNAGSAVRLTVSGYSSPTVAGAAHSANVTAYDANNNVAAGYTGTVHVTSSDTNAVLPTNYTFVAGDAGVHALSATLATAGTQSLSANDTTTASIGGGQTGIIVNAGAAVRLTATGYANPTVAGAAHNVTLTAYDANNNLATGYAGTVHLTSSDTAATLAGNYTFVSGDAGVHALSATLGTVGTQSITGNDTTTASIAGAQTGIVVQPGSANKFTLGTVSSVTAGSPFTILLSALDSYGNVATGYTGTATFGATNDPCASFSPNSNALLTSDHGQITLNNCGTLFATGVRKVTATDGTISGNTNITVNSGPTVHFAFNNYQQVHWFQNFNTNVNAIDPYGNIVTSYNGTATLTSTDPASSGKPHVGSPITLNFSGGQAVAGNTLIASTGSVVFAASDGNGVVGSIRMLSNDGNKLYTNQNANFIVGQSSWTGTASGTSQTSLNNPTGVYFAYNGTLFIADTNNNRVLIYNQTPPDGTGSGSAPNANFVIGQPDFTTNTAGTNAYTMNGPTFVSSDGNNGLFVVDAGNHRVLHYSALPSASNVAADHVIGQADFNSSVSACGRNTMISPAATHCYPGQNACIITDKGANRAVVYTPMIPTTSNPTPMLVLGQPDFNTCTAGTSATKMNGPFGVVGEPPNIYIMDSLNNRVTVWQDLGAVMSKGLNGIAVDAVVGQTSNTAGGVLAGNPNVATLNHPTYFTYDGTFPQVSDTGNNRLMYYYYLPTPYASYPASAVLGQSSFTTNTVVPAAQNACGDAPYQTAVYVNYFAVACGAGNRILIYAGNP